MVIGLLGFPFYDSNKGCEALAYSFVSVLSKLYDNKLKIINFSGESIETMKEAFPSIQFKGYKMRLYNLICHICECDYIVDCTYGDNFSDIYSLPFVARTTLYKLTVLAMRKKLILAPQTIGPFNNAILKITAKEILRKSEIVFSRDEISSFYADDIAGVRPITVTDLAFLLPYEKTSYSFSNRYKIGINVSGLLWEGGFNKDNQFGLKLNYQSFIQELITKLKELDYEIHLIPHVIASKELNHDDDVEICVQLSRKFNTVCAPAFKSPIEAKSYISNMNIFIGSRMHSTIAAFSSGVVTIPISYSRKFQGLYSNIGYNYIIDAKEMDENTAIDKIIRYVLEPETLCFAQRKSMEKIKVLEDKFFDTLNNSL